MTALISAWLWLSAPRPIVAVESEAACPAAEDVTSRVAALLPARTTGDGPDVVRLARSGAALRVSLSRPDGTPVGERTLDGGFPCADLAAATAVIVAAWESDVHAEFRSGRLPALAPEVAAHTAPAPAPAPAAPRADTGALELGAAVTGSMAPASASAGLAAGGLLVASWVPARHRLGARLAAASTTERQLPLDTGHVSWRRVEAALGPLLRLGGASAWAVDVHAEAVVSLLGASGDGFVMNRSASTVEPGVGAGVRLLRRGAAPLVVPWLELAAAGWLRPQAAYATPAGASVDLPRLEATLALGVSYCACR
jgi:hypothetical protein